MPLRMATSAFVFEKRHWSSPQQCYLHRLCTLQQVKCIHTHTHLTALCLGLPGWVGTRKVKPIWILLKQETVSGSGISWAICKSAPCSRQITTPATHHSVFTGQMPFLPPNQQCQSSEGTNKLNADYKNSCWDREYKLTGYWLSTKYLFRFSTNFTFP